eukprot:10364581-Karenia_brevis.AAC.1
MLLHAFLQHQPTHQNIDKAKTDKEQLQEAIKHLRGCIQQQFSQQKQELQHAFDTQDTTQLYQLWNLGVFSGFQTFFDQESKAEYRPNMKELRSLGHVQIRSVPIFPPMAEDTHTSEKTLRFAPTYLHSRKLAKQLERLQRIIAYIKKHLHHNPVDTQHHDIIHLWQVVGSHYTLIDDHKYPSDLRDHRHRHLEFTPSFLLSVTKLHKFVHQQYVASIRQHKVQQASDRKQRLLHSPYEKATYKFLKHDHIAPLVALQDESGRFITDSVSMDTLLRRTWEK